jgi:ADP-heptose:LPS heptosyltransferase
MKNKRPSDLNAEGIVVIKIDAIGDFLIWLDSASQYRKIYGKQRITLICNDMCSQIAYQTGLFDEIVEINNKRFETDRDYKRNILKSFEKSSYRLLLQTAYSRTVDMDILAYNIPSIEKIAFKADESRINLSRYMAFMFIRRILDRAYDKLLEPGQGKIMELERNANFIKGIGGEFKYGYPKLPVFDVDKGIIPQKPYAVIFPGASSGKKMWQIKRFSEVGEYLIKEKNLDIYLCGGKGEAYLYNDFIDNISDDWVKRRVYDYFGKTSLTELAEVIRNAELLVGNDTSGIHFAAATNTRGICIFGDFAYGRFLPYKCENDDKVHNPIVVCHANMNCAGCAYGKITKECKANLMKTGRYLCMDRVSVEQVMGEINRNSLNRNAK